ncbi:MAG TPA: FBP domain-containing protein [Candidatus Saccharimonadia bacterium]|nr:FBP domain-containing protein [Candidatus Saccharimonadia bacterium]
MRTINPEQFRDLVQQARVKPRLRRELRFGASTTDISPEIWSDLELISVSDRSGNEGVLLIEPDDNLYILPYELSIGLTDQATGRSKPIICDLCTTWQAGGNAATITFHNPKTTNNITFLCCADLKCSLHVRSQTRESLLSRSQLREDLTNEQRADRLRRTLIRLIEAVGLKPVGAMTPLGAINRRGR